MLGVSALIVFGSVGTFVYLNDVKNKQRDEIRDTMGNMEEGVADGVAWGITMVTGPQVKEGDERLLAIRSADFDGTQNWREHYKDAKCEAIETIDEKECYKVILAPKHGKPITTYYDRKTHFEVKSEILVNSPMGEMLIESYPSEYKSVDGVMIPHKIRQVVAGIQEMFILTETVEHNTDIPAERFELPQEIRDLVEKKKAATEKADSAPSTPDDKEKPVPSAP